MELMSLYELLRRARYKCQFNKGSELSSNSFIVAFVFVTAVKFLPSCCLATIRGYTCRNTD
jgi:hypothetical protein